MATELLVAAISGQTVTGTYKHDAESLAWVLLYVIYGRARNDTRKHPDNAPLVQNQSALEEEFRRLFLGTSLRDLKGDRDDAFADGDAIKYLMGYFRHGANCDNMNRRVASEIMEYTWAFLKTGKLYQIVKYSPLARLESRDGGMEDAFARRSNKKHLHTMKILADNLQSYGDTIWEQWLYTLTMGAHFAQDKEEGLMVQEWIAKKELIKYSLPA